ncbi:hypothetical protein GJAV_G00000820 [Gymnothorax javanicus]|nr:hypothetical protein GJAV_G00000820 [Gymnothorax javanicus]
MELARYIDGIEELSRSTGRYIVAHSGEGHRNSWSDTSLGHHCLKTQSRNSDMTQNLCRTVLLFVFSLVELHDFCYAEFEITVPRAPFVAIHGRAAILSCSFPVGGAFSLGSSAITWQRHQEVVHSYYHGRDQLDRQGSRYVNRTSLYHSELARGNASLRLDRTTLEDAGEYTCSVSTLSGSQQKSFPLKVAAFYTEPLLQVIARPQGVELRLTSRGYPSPEVHWLDAAGVELSNETQTELLRDTQGLYTVSSRLSSERGTNSSITFILTNMALEQEIRREFSLQTEAPAVPSRHSRLVVCAVFGTLSALCLGSAALGVAMWIRKRRSAANEEEKSHRQTVHEPFI